MTGCVTFTRQISCIEYVKNTLGMMIDNLICLNIGIFIDSDYVLLKLGVVMFKSLVAILFISQISFASPSKVVTFAVDKDLDPYFTITKMIVTELETPKALIPDYLVSKSGNVILTFDKLVALGKKVWKIVEAGKPVVHADFSPTVSVIPFNKEDSATTTFSEMTNWSMPKAKSYRVVYKNGFGASVVSFTYTVMFQYGGKFNDVGNYLAGISIYASDVDVSWGFDFSAKSSLLQISNHGSSADQLAGATFRIDYVVKTVLKEIRISDSFHVMGNGQFSKF